MNDKLQEQLKNKLDEIARQSQERMAHDMEREVERIKSLSAGEQKRYRRRVMYVTADALGDILSPPQPKYVRIFEGFPEDAEIVAVEYDSVRQQFALVIASAIFDIVPSGYAVPQNLHIMVTRYDVKEYDAGFAMRKSLHHE